MAHPRVFSARGGAIARHPRACRYVGRGPCPCRARSCAHGPGGLGNPFTVERHGARCLILFVLHVEDRIRSQPPFGEALDGLRGFDLFCWCAPERCHADVYARLAAVDAPTPASRRELRLALCVLIRRELEAELAGAAR